MAYGMQYEKNYVEFSWEKFFTDCWCRMGIPETSAMVALRLGDQFYSSLARVQWSREVIKIRCFSILCHFVFISYPNSKASSVGVFERLVSKFNLIWVLFTHMTPIAAPLWVSEIFRTTINSKFLILPTTKIVLTKIILRDNHVEFRCFLGIARNARDGDGPHCLTAMTMMRWGLDGICLPSSWLQNKAKICWSYIPS